MLRSIAFPQDFGFLLNSFSFGGNVPLEITSGVFLDKATPPERGTIQALLKDLGGLADFGMLFKVEPVPLEVQNSSAWDRMWWPRKTFWVIRGGNSQLVDKLCAASRLCDCELELGAAFPPAGNFSPRVINQSSFFHYPSVQCHGDTQHLDVSDVASIDPLRLRLAQFEAVKENDVARGSIIRLFEKFISISAGKRYGDLPLVGHFALIEGLVTHDQHRNAGDSITHQLITKMPLLMRRFRRPLTLSDYIDIDDSGEAWRRLYKLRSRIAHGGEGFSMESDCQLRSASSAFRLVRETLKRVFELALHEPEFLSDLKKC